MLEVKKAEESNREKDLPDLVVPTSGTARMAAAQRAGKVLVQELAPSKDGSREQLIGNEHVDLPTTNSGTKAIEDASSEEDPQISTTTRCDASTRKGASKRRRQA